MNYEENKKKLMETILIGK